MIQAENLTIAFPHKPILDHQFFQVKPGEIVGLLGLNGSGKTTILETLFGLRSRNPSVSGQVYWQGRLVNPLCQQPELAFFLYQDPWTPKSWTGRRLVHEFLGSGREAQRLLNQPFFQEFGALAFSSLSGGERRVLELLTALATRRQVFFLDEPFSELSPLRAEFVRAQIRAQSANRLFILTGHSFPEMAELCTRFVVLTKGRLLEATGAEDLRRLGYLPERP